MRQNYTQLEWLELEEKHTKKLQKCLNQGTLSLVNTSMLVPARYSTLLKLVQDACISDLLLDNTKISHKKTKELLMLCPGLQRLTVRQSLKQFDFKLVGKTTIRELELDSVLLKDP